ncbi:hypothetical protein Trco_003876 [Trichoderma cornu-damae]|uniref:Histone H4 n=1 Tax=Trichoderma cornu-damae TaxID=654480 RepID=A0A9P8QQU3_9HYPO|nr:hypothetical protein Trco_003876 [Trichoderma cornu-damae]
MMLIIFNLPIGEGSSPPPDSRQNSPGLSATSEESDATVVQPDYEIRAEPRWEMPSENVLGIKKPALRRLARRGGIDKITEEVFQEARDAMTDYVKEVMKDIVESVEARGANIVTMDDVKYGIDRRGQTSIGFVGQTTIGFGQNGGKEATEHGQEETGSQTSTPQGGLDGDDAAKDS